MENSSEQERIIYRRERSAPKPKGWLGSIKKATKEMKKSLCAVITICQADQTNTSEEETDISDHVESVYTSLEEEVLDQVNRPEEDVFDDDFDNETQSSRVPEDIGLLEASAGVMLDAAYKKMMIRNNRKKIRINNEIQQRNAPLMLEIIKFVKGVEKIVQDGICIKEASYTPLHLLFYMKEMPGAIPMDLEWAEVLFHVAQSKITQKSVDLHSEIIEYFIAEGLEPTICIQYWISCHKPLEEAYASMYRIVLKSIQGKNKNGTKTDRVLIFYNAVLKGIRNKISYKLAELEELRDPEFEESALFTQLVEKILLSSRVQGHLNPNIETPETNAELERIHREFLSENLEEEIESIESESTAAEPTDPKIPLQTVSDATEGGFSDFISDTDAQIGSASSKAAEELQRSFLNTTETPEAKEGASSSARHNTKDDQKQPLCTNAHKQKIKMANKILRMQAKKQLEKPAEKSN